MALFGIKKENEVRILLIHVPYRIRGGEDLHIEFLSDCYRELGYEVDLLTGQEAANFSTMGQALGLVPWKKKDWIEDIERKRPCLIHLHNIHPTLGPALLSWLERASPAPVWMTAHNHRFFCTNGLALREGIVCKDCSNSKIYLKPILQNCNGSIAKSIYHSISLTKIRSQGLWQKSISRWIAPSPYMAEELARIGIPGEKIRLLRHAVSVSPTMDTRKKYDFVFAGRLSQEKGAQHIPNLALAMPNYRFLMVGDGPLRIEVEEQSKKIKNLTYVPSLPHSELMGLVSQGRVGLIPSLCQEALSLFALECLSLGLRLVVSHLSSMNWLTQSPYGALAANSSSIESLKTACEKAISLPQRGAAEVEELKTEFAKDRYKKNLAELLREEGLATHSF
jgi:glycosyltransferase involved in cell wall biosynthesis